MAAVASDTTVIIDGDGLFFSVTVVPDRESFGPAYLYASFTENTFVLRNNGTRYECAFRDRGEESEETLFYE
jgi:hypothetical protein